MVGAYIRINGHDPQRAIILEVDGWRARVKVIDGIRPFIEYGTFPPQTHYRDRGWVAKSQLFGLRSNRISEGNHASSVATYLSEVLNG